MHVHFTPHYLGYLWLIAGTILLVLEKHEKATIAAPIRQTNQRGARNV